MKKIVEGNRVKTFLLLAVLIFNTKYFEINAQRKWKDYLFTGSAMFASGMIDGTIESINYHYENGFKKRCPNANDQFWNPAISWKNKYKNGNSEDGPRFTGSTNILVCTTDGYHMLRASKRSIDVLALSYYFNKNYIKISEKNYEYDLKDLRKFNKRKRWKNIATDFIVLSAIRCVGFNVTYSLLFNPKSNYLQN